MPTPRMFVVRVLTAAGLLQVAGVAAALAQNTPPASLPPNASGVRDACASNGGTGCWPSCGCGSGCGCAAAMRVENIDVPLPPGGSGFASSNVVLLSRISLPEFGAQFTSGSDSAGYVSPSGREYAIMGLNSAVAFVEITNPRSPQIIGFVPKPNSIWADTVVYQNYAYVVSDSAGNGIQVVDLSNIDQGLIAVVNTITPSNLRTVHSAFVNGPTLYLAGSNAPTSGLIALSLANPVNPVIVGTYPGAYVHDMQVVNYTSGPYAGKEIAFCYMGSRGFDIVDVTNKAAMTRLSRTTYPNLAYCHQGWIDFSTNLIYVNDELDETNIANALPAQRRVFNVSNLSAPTLVGTFVNGLNVVDHNNEIRDGFLFAADYKAGMRIFDLRANAINPPTVGWFDSSPGADARTFNGAWNTHPYFPSGVCIISDLEGGLFVVDPTFAVTGGAPFAFQFPAPGAPTLLSPDGPQVAVTITGQNGYSISADPSRRPVLNYRVGASGPFTAVPMTAGAGAGVFVAQLPPVACLSTIQYYVAATDNLGRTQNQPLNAPFDLYTARSAYFVNPASPSGFSCNIPGDANGDGSVNFTDLNIVLSQVGASGAPGALPGDVNFDGVVNFSDLNIVLGSFGRTP